MDYGIFNVHTDVNACDCTRGCTDTVRESALKVDSRRQIPCLTGEWREYTHTYIGQRVFFFLWGGKEDVSKWGTIWDISTGRLQSRGTPQKVPRRSFRPFITSPGGVLSGGMVSPGDDFRRGTIFDTTPAPSSRAQPRGGNT